MAAIMAARAKAGPEMPKSTGSGEQEKANDGMDALSLTAKAAMDAIHAKDHEKFKDTMQSFHDLHSAMRSEHDESEGPKDAGN